MANLNTIIEISEMCKLRKIEMKITEAGLVLSAVKDGKTISKCYDLESINIITLDFPVEIMIDIFLEESVLNFNKAVNCA